MRKTMIRLFISNAVALMVFYLMYQFGVSMDIPLVQQYFMIPLAILIGYLIKEDYKELRKVQQTVI
ncbi:hypothetical protein [Clostridium formicaceticum]|uniref:Uncharacterized protein n=1 Tax=Clostridium formicaceticum TaxID=1497 RepID=A0AAC9RQN6_9CLOT|nr:hypothetical protein [Clostridium formicaceticum]AOY75367.1 hypothetical protein BJL90_05310 [Clostridium formicaceticum]ARE89822.1 hypothetical protein CLFO_43050 [Clostridium formicaceticum]